MQNGEHVPSRVSLTLRYIRPNEKIYTYCFIAKFFSLYPVFSLFLDSIPVNTYTTTATVFLDGIPINTINGPNLNLASCLATSINESPFKDLKL